MIFPRRENDSNGRPSWNVWSVVARWPLFFLVVFFVFVLSFCFNDFFVKAIVLCISSSMSPFDGFAFPKCLVLKVDVYLLLSSLAYFPSFSSPRISVTASAVILNDLVHNLKDFIAGSNYLSSFTKSRSDLIMCFMSTLPL